MHVEVWRLSPALHPPRGVTASGRPGRELTVHGLAWSRPGRVDGDASSGRDGGPRPIAVLELHGTEVLDAAVVADPVAEDLDALEDRGFRVGGCRQPEVLACRRIIGRHCARP